MAKLNGKDIIGIITKGRLVKSQKKTVTPKATVQIITPDAGYDSLSEVIVEAGYTNSIASYLDKSMTNITADDLSTIESIGEIGLAQNKKGTFEGFDKLESAVIPENIILIGDRAFSGCKELVNITLPDSLTEIGASAFYNCSKLKNINVPASLKKMGIHSLYGTKWYDEQWMLHCYDKDEDIYFGKHLYKVHPYKETRSIKADTIEIAGGAAGGARIESVVIPNKVVYIGDEAFNGSGLTSVTFDDNSSLKEIGEGAFESTNIENITIPDSVTRIGYEAFAYTNIKSIIIPANVTYVGGRAFANCYELVSASFIGDKIEILGGSLFDEDSKLETVSLPSGLKQLNGTFYGCSALKTITIPEGVTEIGWNTFDGCTSLTAITIPSSVIKLYDLFSSNGSSALITFSDIENSQLEYIGCLQNCTGLTAITIPKNISGFGYAPFDGCVNLKEVTWDAKEYVPRNGSTNVFNGVNLETVNIGPNVEKLTSLLFSGQSTLTTLTFAEESKLLYIGSHAFQHCIGLTSVRIPDSVTNIDQDAFYNCTGLTNVTIGSGVTNLGSYSFSKCTNLSSVTIKKGVTHIGDYAFSGCSSLTSVTIPDSVTSIGSGSFMGCTGLTKLTMLPTTPPSTGYFNFLDNVNSVNEIVVPAGCGNAYKAANGWSEYADKIVEATV